MELSEPTAAANTTARIAIAVRPRTAHTAGYNYFKIFALR
jgi:hypothetical protein